MDRHLIQSSVGRGLKAMVLNLRSETISTDWQAGLPLLVGTNFTLRELRFEDAASLYASLTTEEVARFISPPPTNVEGFERFIQWTQTERAAGRFICFGIVPNGQATAVGMFQLRALDSSFQAAEWGFALDFMYWGTGIFAESAKKVVDFAIDVVGTLRLEARAALANGRGNGALAKLGAVKEGVLRRSFVRNGVHHDQALWAIVAEEWLLRRFRTIRTEASVN
ncbi:MAG TPA: GNAT family protein [Vicinamibacterales bacterium]|nr:GNAT family protein [Vicinamibacterales bacterium]